MARFTSSRSSPRYLRIWRLPDGGAASGAPDASGSTCTQLGRSRRSSSRNGSISRRVEVTNFGPDRGDAALLHILSFGAASAQPFRISLTDLAGEKVSFFDAAILIFSPFAGLRPSRSAVSLTLNLPNPGSAPPPRLPPRPRCP